MLFLTQVVTVLGSVCETVEMSHILGLKSSVCGGLPTPPLPPQTDQ
jgi:hypothetical protein